MPSFEEQLNELEQVVAKLESGGLPLEDSVQLFEDGVRLSNSCKTQLAAAESRIQVLLQPAERGAVRMRELDIDDADEIDGGDSSEGPLEQE